MNIANFFSLLRLLFLPFFVISLLYYSPERAYLRQLALVLVLLSFCTDFLDGYFARKKGLQTNLGAFLDPIGDKLLINAAFLILILKPEFSLPLKLPLWVVGVVFGRDAFLALGSFILYQKKKFTVRPSSLGKFAVAVQMLAVISALVYFPHTVYIWYFCGIITIISGLGYLLREVLSLSG